MAKKSLYDDIVQGLNEALEDASGPTPILKRRRISIEPVKLYNAEDVKRIRGTTGMSQKNFASYLGVSDKTVEAWEAGTNRPSGAASRILRMMELDKNLVVKFPFVSNTVAK